MSDQIQLQRKYRTNFERHFIIAFLVIIITYHNTIKGSDGKISF